MILSFPPQQSRDETMKRRKHITEEPEYLSEELTLWMGLIQGLTCLQIHQTLEFEVLGNDLDGSQATCPHIYYMLSVPAPHTALCCDNRMSPCSTKTTLECQHHGVNRVVGYHPRALYLYRVQRNGRPSVQTTPDPIIDRL